MNRRLLAKDLQPTLPLVGNEELYAQVCGVPLKGVEGISLDVKKGRESMSEYSYDQGEENWLNDLLGKGAGDPDFANPPYTRPDEEYEPIESDTN